MKKFFRLLIISLLITAMALSLSACELGVTGLDNSADTTGNDNVHTHDYVMTITKQPTCISAGTKKFECSCGDSYTTNISPLGCEFTNYVSNNDATCTKDGTKTARCNRPNCPATNTIPDNGSMLSHELGKEKIIREATCGESGIYTYECLHCGKASSNKIYNLQSYSASEVYELTKDSVGEIITYNKNGGELALGTGFVYGADGKIITNFHVIEDAYSAEITISGTSYTIQKILAYDEEIDLAVLKINASNLKAVDICLKEHVVGKSVYAFGSSKGLTATFSQGIITYANREIDGVEYVQHDAAISSGNSGGPLINQYCEVIGINTMTVRDSQNLNFAIRTTEIQNLDFSNPIDFGEHNPDNSGTTTPSSPTNPTDIFSVMRSYAVTNGEYKDGVYTVTFATEYSSDYKYIYIFHLGYDYIEDEFSLDIFVYSSSYSFLVSIDIDTIDGVYDWSYIDSYEYYMSGVINGNTWDTGYLLGYSYNNISSTSLRSSIRELASSSVNLLLFAVNAYLSENGITAYKLGFVNF